MTPAWRRKPVPGVGATIVLTLVGLAALWMIGAGIVGIVG